MPHLRHGALLSACLLVGAASCSSPEGESPDMISNRLWLEKAPEKPTEHVHAFAVVSRPKQGIFSRSSSYDLHFELFTYAREEGRVKLTFPQTDKKASFTYTITSCDADPFDLCLDLSDNPWGGPKRYYARKADTFSDDVGAVEALRRAQPSE